MHKARPIISASDKKRFLAIISESCAEMDRLREIMQEDDIKIAASFARTRAIIDEMKAVRLDDRWIPENAVHEKEKLLLRMEITRLRSEQRILTGKEPPYLIWEDTDEKR